MCTCVGEHGSGTRHGPTPLTEHSCLEGRHWSPSPWCVPVHRLGAAVAAVRGPTWEWCADACLSQACMQVRGRAGGCSGLMYHATGPLHPHAPHVPYPLLLQPPGQPNGCSGRAAAPLPTPKTPQSCNHATFVHVSHCSRGCSAHTWGQDVCTHQGLHACTGDARVATACRTGMMPNDAPAVHSAPKTSKS